MELTIEQALQQGEAAYKGGRLEDAERLFCAILQSQPKHPDANHNLGLIAVSVNKTDVALPLFKTALEANPQKERFWVSYIDALIKRKQFGSAKKVLEQGKKAGWTGQKVDALEGQLLPIPEIKKTNSASPSRQQIDRLLKYFQAGRHGDAEKLARFLIQGFPKHQLAWKLLGAVLVQTGRNFEAVDANQTAVAISPQDAEVHYNLSNALKELDRKDEAEASLRQAIALQPDFATAHYNLGNILQGRDRLGEAEASYRQVTSLQPDYAEAHNNLGIVLKELGRLDEAEASYTQAIALKPDYAAAHNNLGNTLHDLGRLEQAEASYRQAISFKSDFAEAHSNLGITLKELGRLDEAKASYEQAIALKPDYADAYFNLTKVLYILGNKNSALASIEKANKFDPKSKNNSLLLKFMKATQYPMGNEIVTDGTNNKVASGKLSSNPLILNRDVEAELIANLYEMSSRELNKTADARYGNGKCSLDFSLLEDSRSIIKTLLIELTKIMKKAVKSNIFINDSFFNILSDGGGTTPHKHLNEIDEDFNLSKHKYSLVYYLCVGDQNCSEPGFLKLYDPVEEILPTEGMITIIPASRKHSAVYGGRTDRVMIGVNFYSF